MALLQATVLLGILLTPTRSNNMSAVVADFVLLIGLVGSTVQLDSMAIVAHCCVVALGDVMASGMAL